jgi:hypothetical protein
MEWWVSRIASRIAMPTLEEIAKFLRQDLKL